MANTLLALSTKQLIKNAIVKPSVVHMSTGSYTRELIGKREVVGYGFNGEPSYIDRSDYPLPAIRWRPPNADILALREKEKGDWKLLSIEEKKALYRASFRQTFAEFDAPTGEWKYVVAVGCILVSTALWMFYALRMFVCTPLPDTFKPENREAQMRRMLDLQVNPIEGLSSKWDYEKDDWKK